MTNPCIRRHGLTSNNHGSERSIIRCMLWCSCSACAQGRGKHSECFLHLPLGLLDSHAFVQTSGAYRPDFDTGPFGPKSTGWCGFLQGGSNLRPVRCGPSFTSSASLHPCRSHPRFALPPHVQIQSHSSTTIPLPCLAHLLFSLPPRLSSPLCQVFVPCRAIYLHSNPSAPCHSDLKHGQVPKKKKEPLERGTVAGRPTAQFDLWSVIRTHARGKDAFKRSMRANTLVSGSDNLQQTPNQIRSLPPEKKKS